ncbi:hypothetical protein N9L68_07365 [bacterium]|nr:hypothetical protein [bacterium]
MRRARGRGPGLLQRASWARWAGAGEDPLGYRPPPPSWAPPLMGQGETSAPPLDRKRQ